MAGQSMKVTMYGCFEKRVAQVTAKAWEPGRQGLDLRWANRTTQGRYRHLPLFSSLHVARLPAGRLPFLAV